MAWWKKILNTIPIVFAGYEVGKTVQNPSDTKAIVEAIDDQIEKTNKLNNIEIVLMSISIMIGIAYLIKLIRKAISKSITNISQSERI